MATWAGPYNCTDCGKKMDRAGTCTECLIANNPVPEQLKRDIEKTKPKAKRK